MLLFKKFRGCKSVVIFFVLLYSFLVYNIFNTILNTLDILEHNNISNISTQSSKFKLKSGELKLLIDELTRDQINYIAVQTIIDKLESKLERSNSCKNEPTTEYEKLRRRVRQNTEGLWNYISSKLKMMMLEKFGLVDVIRKVMELGAEHKRSLISDMDEMRMIDGYEQWRYDEAKSLSDLILKRLNYLQNPKDCKAARKLVCNLNDYAFGYGCELHHINYCFILAYATERTLIFNSSTWPYQKSPWDDLYHPLSETCLNIDPTANVEEWPGQHDAEVLIYKVNPAFTTWPPYLPLSIPADLAPRLMRLNGDPGAWWVSQFLKYLLRPKNATRTMFETRMKKLGFKKPIVGVQIRRTDKIDSEAAYHGIEEYMTYVEDYFLKLEMNGTHIKRRVFLATDEASVIDEARKKYPSYKIIADPDIARMGDVSRYSDESLKGIVSDIHILSLCDYLVCTFTSNICRNAYEIMHTMYPDASNRVQSLDDIYFYVQGYTHNSEAVISHHPQNDYEMKLKLGDQIKILVGIDWNWEGPNVGIGSNWGGYLKGENTRSNQAGLIPVFKVIDKFDAVKFPTYANVT